MTQPTMLLALLLAAPLALAATPPPQPLAPPQALPTPRDVRWPGTIELQVDASDTRRRIVTVHEQLPVNAAGALVLFYPRWEMASHAPTIAVQQLAGLVIHAGNQRLAWTRDPLDPHAFHVDVPAGTQALDINFQYLAPLTRDASAKLLRDFVGLDWNRLLLYPAGHFVRQIAVHPRLTLPAGFQHASALRSAASGDQVDFETTSLERLIDSPVFAAPQVARRAVGGPGSTVQAHWLATDAAALQRAEALDCPMARLLAETRRVFGADPFARYDFLIALDDRLPGPGGIEHRESSEVFLPADFLSAPASYLPEIDVLAHELIHAWNGMQRVPADLWAPTPNTPMRNSLLWMYEGQTEFWSRVIAARAGLRSVQDTRDLLAIDAASVETRAGRAWKNLADSALDPTTLYRGLSMSWRDWQRREDYYVEGVLLWLAIDGRLRERSGGRHGLDDFAADFFGHTTPATATQTYTADDIARTLARRVPGDWRRELRGRVEGHENGPVLDGLASHGWRLAYRAQPTPLFLQHEKNDGITDLSASIGATVTAKGVVKSVAWQGPAFRAGLVPGMRVLQVGESPFSAAALVDAVARTEAAPGVQLTMQVDDRQETLQIDWRGGLRYPVLERIADRPDGLMPLLAPRTTASCTGLR